MAEMLGFTRLKVSPELTDLLAAVAKLTVLTVASAGTFTSISVAVRPD